jgi:hypothetical protein
MLECDNIGMEKFFHYLKFSILIALVLIDLLYRNDFPGLSNSCLKTVLSSRMIIYLKNDTERAVANNSICIVCETCLHTID